MAKTVKPKPDSWQNTCKIKYRQRYCCKPDDNISDVLNITSISPLLVRKNVPTLNFESNPDPQGNNQEQRQQLNNCIDTKSQNPKGFVTSDNFNPKQDSDTAKYIQSDEDSLRSSEQRVGLRLRQAKTNTLSLSLPLTVSKVSKLAFTKSKNSPPRILPESACSHQVSPYSHDSEKMKSPYQVCRKSSNHVRPCCEAYLLIPHPPDLVDVGSSRNFNPVVSKPAHKAKMIAVHHDEFLGLGCTGIKSVTYQPVGLTAQRSGMMREKVAVLERFKKVKKNQTSSAVAPPLQHVTRTACSTETFSGHPVCPSSSRKIEHISANSKETENISSNYVDANIVSPDSVTNENISCSSVDIKYSSEPETEAECLFPGSTDEKLSCLNSFELKTSSVNCTETQYLEFKSSLIHHVNQDVRSASHAKLEDQQNIPNLSPAGDTNFMDAAKKASELKKVDHTLAADRMTPGKKNEFSDCTSDTTQSNNKKIAEGLDCMLNSCLDSNKGSAKPSFETKEECDCQKQSETRTLKKGKSRSFSSNFIQGQQSKGKPAASQHCPGENYESQYQLTAQKAVQIYSQKLGQRRKQSNKNHTNENAKKGEKESERLLNKRVRSAQPHVFRKDAKLPVKVKQCRASSASEVASRKDSSSRTTSKPNKCDSGDSNPENDQHMDDQHLTWVMTLWTQCVSAGTVDKIIPVIRRLPFTQRQQLANTDWDAKSMLLISCEMGSMKMVDFLLNECGADIEKKGRIVVRGSQPILSFEASPLWCASFSGHVELVKKLICHGANLNCETSHGSTPLLSACFLSLFEVVKTLIQAGADIHTPNYMGSTCLINSVQCPELVKLLLTQGARPNAEDRARNTALHYAASVGQIESIKLLIQFGGDCRHTNHSGLTPLQQGALKGWIDIVNFFIYNTHIFKFQEAIEAYELLGCGLVDAHEEYDLGVELWRRALILRSTVFPKTNLRQKRIAAFQHKQEFITENELNKICSDQEDIKMQSLLIMERICGSTCKEVISAAMSRAILYYVAGMFQPCFHLLKYVFYLRSSTLHPLSRAVEYTSYKITKLFLDREEEIKQQHYWDWAAASEALDTLTLLIQHLDKAKIALQHYLSSHHPDNCPCDVCDTAGTLYPRFIKCRCDCHSTGAEETYFLFMTLALQMVRILATYLELSPDELQRFHSLVYQLVKSDHRNHKGDSLLHMCFLLCELDPKSEEQRFPTLSLLKTLIECGVDIDALNTAGEPPLYYIMSTGREAWTLIEKHPDKKTWILLLLNHNAHVDRIILGQHSLLKALTAVTNICPIKYLSLQCLAAQAIRKHSVPYDDPQHLPSELILFVSYH